jgi:TolB-like protein
MQIAIPAPAVRDQLGKILASEPFARSRRIQRFLKFIVEETLAGRADGLGEYTIGVAVFDRGPDFEPGLDPIVRNDARRLRLKLLEYYRQLEPWPADQLLIDMPKGGYVPVFRMLETRDDAAALRPKRLAVLPFEVLSTARETMNVGRAVCMSLTSNLTSLEDLEVISQSYLPELPLQESASRLGLSHVIQGSVLHSRERFRIIVNLVQVADGAQLWAREFDFESHEMVTFQSEITRTVLAEVTARVGITPHTVRCTRDGSVIPLLHFFSVGDLESAVSARCLDLDPQN